MGEPSPIIHYDKSHWNKSVQALQLNLNYESNTKLYLSCHTESFFYLKFHLCHPDWPIWHDPIEGIHWPNLSSSLQWQIRKYTSTELLTFTNKQPGWHGSIKHAIENFSLYWSHMHRSCRIVRAVGVKRAISAYASAPTYTLPTNQPTPESRSIHNRPSMYTVSQKQNTYFCP